MKKILTALLLFCVLTTSSMAEEIKSWPIICGSPEEFLPLVEDEKLTVIISTAPTKESLVYSIWKNDKNSYVMTLMDLNVRQICIVFAFTEGQVIQKK